MQLRSIVVFATAAMLCACSTLPSSGPTGSQILKQTRTSDEGIALIEVVDATSLPGLPAPATMPLPDILPPPTDMVGPGDVLEISIYEAGVSLFGSGQASAETPGFDPSAKAHVLPPRRVDDNGDIVIPYAGPLRVSGKTIPEIEVQIRGSLRGFSEDPQVLVTEREVVTNSIIVSGEVAKPGRLVLLTNRETLTDAVALAGGYRGRAIDLILRIVRNQNSVELRLSELLANPALDVRAYRGDRLTLISDPRTFSVLGAPGRVDEISFARPTVSLVQAVAAAGGSSPNFGDAAAIFVFRYVTDPGGQTKPVVYHFNMARPGAYFLAQRFAMQDKDVLYVGNAKANQPSKLIQLVSQLFSPILTATAAVQAVQN